MNSALREFVDVWGKNSVHAAEPRGGIRVNSDSRKPRRSIH